MASRTRSLRTALALRLPALTRPLTPGVVLGLRPLIATALRLPLQSRVRATMTAALGVPPSGQTVGRYFARLADVAAFSLLIYRAGVEAANLEAMCEPEPGAREILDAALEAKKGGILLLPHLSGSELLGGSFTRYYPTTLVARRSPDPDYQAAKERWYQALGVGVLWRPRRATHIEGLEEMTRALRVLRKNNLLALTPDLIRSTGTGVPVQLFGRTAELPAGPFFLGARTGSPLLAGFFHYTDNRYHLSLAPPLTTTQEDRDAAIAELAQAWATLFESFIREHPEMWQFWLDKRWSRWLQETPK
jgi:hypothetical protein